MIGVVDIGGTKMSVGIVAGPAGVAGSGGDGPRLEGRREEATLPERGFDSAVERIAAMFGELSKTTGSPAIDGLAIGSTGPIDRVSGVFGRVDTLPGFEGSNLKEAMGSALGVDRDRIVIENDADAAALGEATYGVGRGCSRFMYVTISTGIGGGFIVDGRIYRGAGGIHPEIGHQMIEASAGPRCTCGARGCWEILASGSAMAGGDLTRRTAEMICAAAKNDEEWARRIVEREAFYLGVGIANLISMFAPDVIALGGGVMRSADLFLDRIREVVNESCTLVPAKTASIVTATLGADAGLLGAAQAFFANSR